ncbi:DUF2332 domain-containing protein [Ensifer sp. LCM 4579]|uniref:DUF2332 domain-containing protein n=1 Tax=Ensifer sp. LCM 4579 TaxID=1848292 RepID=UPI0008DA7E3B|nr:DUF2332 domain-containing protein [Ensifer sp. LCM 4579]OHV71844.1 hypothetical protein LCM4579_13770 [Ensifer sp. LCM 4579]
MIERIADRYRRFAQVEAQGQSPLYEMLALHVAQAPEALRFLMRLPRERQQPNLLFAAMRLAAGKPASPCDFDQALREHADAIAEIMLSRTTQTNEPGRCASLLPALAQIDGPLALIEVGASAGLCLLFDAYGYDWDRQRLAAPGCSGAIAPVFNCEASDATPLPLRHPEIVWRAGLDLNPLNVFDNADVAWLEHLVWPEHESRLARLRAAISLAKRNPPRIERGDLRRDLPDLIAEAPAKATVVVFHTAVLSYIPSRADRNDFATMMNRAGVVWLSNEAPHIFPQFAASAGPARNGMFLLAANGSPIAWTGPHGQSVRWIVDTSRIP